MWELPAHFHPADLFFAAAAIAQTEADGASAAGEGARPTMNYCLFVAERSHGVDSAGAERRNVAGGARYHRQT